MRKHEFRARVLLLLLEANDQLKQVLKGEQKMGQALTDLQAAMADFQTSQNDFDTAVEQALAKLVPAPGGDTIAAADAENVVAQIQQAAATNRTERDKVVAAINALAAAPADTGGATATNT